MKLLVVVVVLFLSFNVCAQNDYIYKKDGVRVEYVKGSVKLIVQDKVLLYTAVTGGQKELNFKDLDYATFGNYKFKYFKLAENKLSNAYFVLGESSKYFLICLGTPDGDEEDASSSYKMKYDMYVVDKDNVVVDGLSFTNQANVKAANARSLISEKINTYFKDCDDLITRLSDFERLNEPQFLGLVGFFKVPNYISCIK